MGSSLRPNTADDRKKQTFSPGPGTYKPIDHAFATVAKYSIGSREKDGNKRLKLTQIRLLADGSHEKLSVFQSEAPGPGAYTANPIFKRTNVGGAFGRESRDWRSRSSQSISLEPSNPDVKRAVLK